MESDIRCDLCHGTTKRLVFRFPNSPFELVECCNCRLNYLDPRPSPAEIGAYYKGDYYTGQAAEESQDKLREQIKRLAYQARCEPHSASPTDMLRWRFLNLALGWRAARRVPVREHGRLLDVGCGNGEYIAWIRDNLRGWQVEGVEINPQAALQAEQGFGLTVHRGQLTDLQLPAEQYDMVSFWHSLEHFFSPANALQVAHRLLRPEGWLAIEVPDIGSWDARHAGARWYHLAVPIHLYHFTQETLVKLVQAHGFQIHSVEHLRSKATLVQEIRADVFPIAPALKPAALLAAKTVGRLSSPALRLYASKR